MGPLCDSHLPWYPLSAQLGGPSLCWSEQRGVCSHCSRGDSGSQRFLCRRGNGGIEGLSRARAEWLPAVRCLNCLLEHMTTPVLPRPRLSVWPPFSSAALSLPLTPWLFHSVAQQRVSSSSALKPGPHTSGPLQRLFLPLEYSTPGTPKATSSDAVYTPASFLTGSLTLLPYHSPPLDSSG